MIFCLGKSIAFPPVELAEKNGMLAIGGDLSTERLLEAYSRGIFPWYNDDEEMVWWSPNPRCVLYPEKVHISKTMAKTLRKNTFAITFDKNFADVIRSCKKERTGQDGTWITDGILNAYTKLHEMGYAHSVEAWQGEALAGGLYGVSLGGIFFGESMFSDVADASKAALITLCRKLAAIGFHCIDCQVSSEHLMSLGAELVPREFFTALVKKSMAGMETIVGNWGELFAD